MSIAELHFLMFVGHVTIGAFVISEEAIASSSPPLEAQHLLEIEAEQGIKRR